uniref:Uncharacterized protein n=1 Tax=uncultured bacterium A1Q1_fos_2140 TaxID=1256565 RepID=L7VXR1_9BACT|nr:hypothetical protein [uncultured bacterium A1Q1_fos_2140]
MLQVHLEREDASLSIQCMYRRRRYNYLQQLPHQGFLKLSLKPSCCGIHISR